jgi:hypothetical protein
MWMLRHKIYQLCLRGYGYSTLCKENLNAQFWEYLEYVEVGGERTAPKHV